MQSQYWGMHIHLASWPFAVFIDYFSLPRTIWPFYLKDRNSLTLRFIWSPVDHFTTPPPLKNFLTLPFNSLPWSLCAFWGNLSSPSRSITKWQTQSLSFSFPMVKEICIVKRHQVGTKHINTFSSIRSIWLLPWTGLDVTGYPSYTKPFGTHPWYHGGRPDPLLSQKPLVLWTWNFVEC